ncbi:hypothetical protein BRE01_67410 [Brevibacillus reuszeri]|uniref:Uncharacterized protein n=1 Tax=Brevibacillus reuszeri TaxID=54915 RepID=A0A0K9YN97_9BACL|nr:hypothetical protein [Brevibacillus reuszeri]KNB70189.1 hypothetical protein ADS79_14565 [Brevibacillus reuszeri]GED73039.1 hypothetical protein BRE01_67410 [Brevibacillus reuszeri]
MSLRNELHKTLWVIEDVIESIAKEDVKQVSPNYIAEVAEVGISDVIECLIYLQSQQKPVKGQLMLKVTCPIHQTTLVEIRGSWLQDLLEQMKDKYWCGNCIDYRPINSEETLIAFELSDEYIEFCKSN